MRVCAQGCFLKRGSESIKKHKKAGVPRYPSYSSVCFAATSSILEEELEYQTF